MFIQTHTFFYQMTHRDGSKCSEMSGFPRKCLEFIYHSVLAVVETLSSGAHNWRTARAPLVVSAGVGSVHRAL